ncbi:hypothetical protein [Streptomyces sp. SYSU K217416]
MTGYQKLWVAAMACAATIASVTGCSKGEDSKAKGDTKESPAAATTQPPVDPFEGLSADEIAQKAVDTTKSATSLRIAGNGKSDGDMMEVDLAVDKEGACVGKMVVKGGTAEILQVDNVKYMKGNEAFWRASFGSERSAGQTDGVIELVKGRWFKMPNDKSGDSLEALCDLKAMITDMDEDKSERKGMTRAADADVNGQPAATLVKEKSGGKMLTLYVAKEGKPYILKSVEVGGDEPGTMHFSDYNKPVAATPPPADQVIDPKKLSVGSRPGTQAL